MERSSTASALRRRRLAVAAWFAVFPPLGVLAALLKVLWLGVATGALALLGAVAVAVLWTRELRAEKEEEDQATARACAERVRVPIGPLGDVSPYNVGVDREATTSRTVPMARRTSRASATSS